MDPYVLLLFGLGQQPEWFKEFASREEALEEGRAAAARCSYWYVLLQGPRGTVCRWELNSQDEVVEVMQQ